MTIHPPFFFSRLCCGYWYNWCSVQFCPGDAMTVYCLSATRKLLLGLKLFRGLDEEALASLLEHAELIEWRAGEYVIREGEQGHELFVLIGGQVEICKRANGIQKVIQTLGPGECFGEMSLIDCRSRSASVRAAIPCKLLRIDGDSIAGKPELAIKIYRNIAVLLSQRLRHANEILALG